jgi:hypothetical protein
MSLEAYAINIRAPFPKIVTTSPAREQTTRPDDLSDRLQAVTTSSLDQEFNGHQRAAFDPRLYISIDAALLMNGANDCTSSCLI